MLILGIETSCDDTTASVVKDGTQVLSSIVQSQNDLHSPFGGVVPEMASRRHLEVIETVVSKAMKTARAGIRDLDLIAVTAGPGLIGSLLVGLSYAKGLSYATGLPLVPVDHILGHLMTLDLAGGTPIPSIALVCSGGHTTLYHLNTNDPPLILGTTLDDAAGEAFDKASNMLGLGYPGGPALEKAAVDGDPEAVRFPRPMSDADTLDFSFSGLKTALFTYLKRQGYFDRTKEGQTLPNTIEDIAASFQAAVIDVLVGRCLLAVRRMNLSDLIIVGGVARNTFMRIQLNELAVREGIEVHYPPLSLCTDNAAMIAALGYRQRDRALLSPMSINAYSTKALKSGRTTVEDLNI